MLALVGVAVEAVLAVRVVVAALAQVAALGARAAVPHAAAVLGSQGQEVPKCANNKAGFYSFRPITNRALLCVVVLSPVHAGGVEQLLVVTGGGDAGVVLGVQAVLRRHTPPLALHIAYIV